MQNKLKQCPFCGGEKEFIERGALLARYDAEHVGPPGRARELITTAPAADVVEVRHGRWISVQHKLARVCSVCNRDEPYKFADVDADVYNYCPNCGAYIMGENNGKCE